MSRAYHYAEEARRFDRQERQAWIMIWFRLILPAIEGR